MSFPSPNQLLARFPLLPEQAAFIQTARSDIRAICRGEDSRLLFIVGPCSIHDVQGGLLYAERLKELSEKVSDRCLIVMRAYIEKPRTRMGWRGLLQDPNLDGSYLIEEGLALCRAFLLELAHLGVPAATEFVTPQAAPYFQDLISWGCIGARTSTSQTHRLLASDLPMPIGFKNTLDGHMEGALNGMLIASQPQVFLHTDMEGKLCRRLSRGNPAPHLVLRGSYLGPNYDEQSRAQAAAKLKRLGFPPRLLIDCSHGNSQKQQAKQKEIFSSLLNQIEQGDSTICGFLIESHLKEGKQEMHPDRPLDPCVSITDPCLNFQETEDLILRIQSLLPL